MPQELKPCPFCPEIEEAPFFYPCPTEIFPGAGRVACPECGASTVVCQTREVAEAKWNTRPTEAALREEVEAAKESAEVQCIIAYKLREENEQLKTHIETLEARFRRFNQRF